eukprot:GFUD01013221.1.p1 GENE.GFUD01013221.1~~GFUD01013221.1.p1  ORF type:complete len:589 (+),score=124.60 GFUD01013221.1:122-1768(+)
MNWGEDVDLILNKVPVPTTTTTTTTTTTITTATATTTTTATTSGKGSCPAGYYLGSGDIPGWGQIRGKIETSLAGCGEECSNTKECCSFEFSVTSGLCNLNRDCQPSKIPYKDYYFCIQNKEGTKWQKVYSHDTAGGLFATVDEAKKKNINDEDADLFSVLYNLKSMRNEDGVFHLKLCYPELTEHAYPCNEWIQSSNPVLESTITGYIGIKETWPKNSGGNAFQGLGLSPPSFSSNLIDDAPSSTSWWNSIGTLKYHGGSDTIPGPVGPTGIIVKKKVLYVEYKPPSCGHVKVTGDNYDGSFMVENLITVQNKELFVDNKANYWLSPNARTATFILNLGCSETFDSIRLVNVHNREHKDRATKQFRLYTSQTNSGPWTQVLDTQLEDSRQQQDPLPIQIIAIDTKTTTQFVKFELVSWWGRGGGLMFFNIVDEVQQVQPVTDVQPVQPVLPALPVLPVQPLQPVKPVLPVEPVQPVQPVLPVLAVEPVLPVQPVQPFLPVKPVLPVEPVLPVKPVQPVLPVLPAQPAPLLQPVQPVLEVPQPLFLRS